jgi:hypothetical protein
MASDKVLAQIQAPNVTGGAGEEKGEGSERYFRYLNLLNF